MRQTLGMAMILGCVIIISLSEQEASLQGNSKALDIYTTLAVISALVVGVWFSASMLLTKWIL